MRNFQDTFESRKPSFISAFSICMTVPLSCLKKGAGYTVDCKPRLRNYKSHIKRKSAIL